MKRYIILFGIDDILKAMRVYNKLKILLIAIILFISTNAAYCGENSYSMDRIDYTANIVEQNSVDEELFDHNSCSPEQYDEYIVYSSEEDADNENTIVLEKNSIKKKNNVKLKAVIEKSYTVNRIEAFNTFWDDSKNFKTIINSHPYFFKELPSFFQETYYSYNTDENSNISWGQNALSSHNDITVGFIDNMESNYDNGLKISTKLGKINLSGAIYDSIHSHTPSGGFVFSTEELHLQKGSLVFGGGLYATDYVNENSRNSAGIFTKYKRGRFSLGIQLAQDKSFTGNKEYGTSCYLYPSFKINDSLTLRGGIASYLDEKYAREEISIVYKPALNNENDFQISLSAAFYNGSGITGKQRIKIKTEFRL